MSRVLVTGGVGTLGVAIVRRLLADPAYDVRVADRKQAPQWMREACELRTVDLTDPGAAAAAMSGCTYAIHLAGPSIDADAMQGDFSLLAAGVALDSALLTAAAEQVLERFVYVSCASPQPQSAYGFAALAGERLCDAAQAEHGLPVTICRLPRDAEDIDQMAGKILAALAQAS